MTRKARPSTWVSARMGNHSCGRTRAGAGGPPAGGRAGGRVSGFEDTIAPGPRDAREDVAAPPVLVVHDVGRAFDVARDEARPAGAAGPGAAEVGDLDRGAF